jgi:hypothetical protein
MKHSEQATINVSFQNWGKSFPLRRINIDGKRGETQHIDIDIQNIEIVKNLRLIQRLDLALVITYISGSNYIELEFDKSFELTFLEWDIKNKNGKNFLFCFISLSVSFVEADCFELTLHICKLHLQKNSLKSILM